MIKSQVPIDDDESWSLAAGTTQWYRYDVATGQNLEHATEIVEVIRAKVAEPRVSPGRSPTTTRHEADFLPPAC